MKGIGFPEIMAICVTLALLSTVLPFSGSELIKDSRFPTAVGMLALYGMSAHNYFAERKFDKRFWISMAIACFALLHRYLINLVA